MRGLAIMAIMLHNLLHADDFGFTKQNESLYLQARSDAFFDAIMSMGTNLFGEVMSFLGWVGVPVFVFLTGYGLARKYPPALNAFNIGRFLKNHYLKLFFLMLPGILFFILLDIKTGAWTNIAKKVFALTMMSNFDFPRLGIYPAIYWYFGLTFQYYVFYCLARKYLNNATLIVLSVLTFFGYCLLVALDCNYATKIYKACLTGWFPVFAIGVWMAKNDIVVKVRAYPLWAELCSFIVLSALLLIANARYESWLFVPFIALLWFMAAAMLSARSEVLGKSIGWIGTISAFIFVFHPVAREFFFKLNLVSLNLFVSVLLYILMTFAMAFGFKFVYQRLLRRFVKD